MGNRDSKPSPSDFEAAIKHGRIASMKRILKTAEIKNPVLDRETGQTALHCAAFFGQPEMCCLILDELDGDKKNPRDNIGQVPLHYALNGQGFCASGPDGSKFCTCGFCLALNPVQWNVAERSRCILAFHEMYGQLQEESEWNPADCLGETPLHTAARYGILDIVRPILSHVGDRQPLDGEGRTPLDAAIEGKTLMEAKYLMDPSLRMSRIKQYDAIIALLQDLRKHG